MPRRTSTPGKPSRSQLAKAFTLLLSIPAVIRGKSAPISGFRSTQELAKWVKEAATAAGIDKTEIKNRLMQTVYDFIEEAAPHVALFAVYAEEQGLTPAQAIVRAAVKHIRQEMNLPESRPATPSPGNGYGARTESKNKK
jgi:hypothetical protein